MSYTARCVPKEIFFLPFRFPKRQRLSIRLAYLGLESLMTLQAQSLEIYAVCICFWKSFSGL